MDTIRGAARPPLRAVGTAAGEVTDVVPVIVRNAVAFGGAAAMGAAGVVSHAWDGAAGAVCGSGGGGLGQ